jgi:hypothetical protein
MSEYLCDEMSSVVSLTPTAVSTVWCPITRSAPAASRPKVMRIPVPMEPHHAESERDGQARLGQVDR